MVTELQRGIRNPEIVDLISLDDRSGEVLLTMIEDRGWTGSPAQLEELEEKCQRYFAYLLDGHFAEQYPQYRGRRIRVQLDCVEPPPAESTLLLQGVTQFARAHGMEFSIRVVRPQEIPRASWEQTGEETGS